MFVKFKLQGSKTMIRISEDHQEFFEAQVASGAFEAPDAVVGKAIELLRGAIDADLISSIDDIRDGMTDEAAGRVRPIGEVAKRTEAELQARK
jgi:Arc/MetJ-type ribon-helix-helix transcriptional regulator